MPQKVRMKKSGLQLHSLFRRKIVRNSVGKKRIVFWANKEIKAPILIQYYVSEQEPFIADFQILGGIPLSRYKKGIASLLVICAFVLTACSSNNQPQQNDVSNITQSVETVIAQRGSLTVDHLRQRYQCKLLLFRLRPLLYLPL